MSYYKYLLYPGRTQLTGALPVITIPFGTITLLFAPPATVLSSLISLFLMKQNQKYRDKSFYK